MRLPKPFYRLPVRFDAERLQAEIRSLPASAWAKHPNEIAGNTSVRLISVDGGENDAVDGHMRATPHLEACPYVRQILASFGVVWSRSRLLRLAPHAQVPEHADINYHWFNRVRVHIPVVTRPEVRFHCGDESVHMAAGQAWVFDNWRLHRVENPTTEERIHIVADTSGTAAFWQLVAQSGSNSERLVRYDPAANVQPLTEHTCLATVMMPAEVDLLLLDLRAELTPQDPSAESSREMLVHYNGLLDAFSRDWRQLYALYGDRQVGWPEFVRLRESVRSASRELAAGLVMRTNRVSAHAVLEGRVLRAMLSLPGEITAHPLSAHSRAPLPVGERERLQRPIFIIAAPRSGSTLLFETLATSRTLCTLRGEAHWLIESIAELQPGAAGVESNRLVAHHASEAIAERVVAEILANACDANGQPGSRRPVVRLLEKTPKNALRIPFLCRIFPDARFIFLWRDPRENLGSILEAWRSGRWRTYNGLTGFSGPWSLLLPPGWRAFEGRPLEEIAAFQWESANRIALDDLAALPRDRWMAVSYARFIADPRGVAQRICEFGDIEFDASLSERVAGPLPLSRQTLTPPAPGKWRKDESSILRVLPQVEPTWRALRELPE